MILILVITVVLAVFFVAATVVPWARGRLADPEVAPDTPQPFGYRTAWLAIESTETQAVLDALGVSEVQCVNWRTGVSATYDEDLSDYYVFISPPVNGTTFVVGLALPHPVGQRFVDHCMPLLTQLSQRFGSVAYFFTYPVIELYAWAKFHKGRLQRAFAWGDEGAIWNRGNLSDIERSLGLDVFELRRAAPKKGGSRRSPSSREYDGAITYPNETHVLKIAAAWSMDPTQLDLLTEETGLGFLGQVPDTWRVKRADPGDRVRNGGAARDKTPAERRAELRPVT